MVACPLCGAVVEPSWLRSSWCRCGRLFVDREYGGPFRWMYLVSERGSVLILSGDGLWRVPEAGRQSERVPSEERDEAVRQAVAETAAEDLFRSVLES